MKINKWKNFLGVLLVFLAAFKYYSVIFDYTNLNKYCMLLSLLLSTLLILINYKKYNLIHLGFFVILSIQFVMSKNITLLYSYYLCLGLFALDFRYLIKWFVIFNAVFFSIFLITNLIGINPTEYIEGRNDFGFGNPNAAFISMFMLWSSFFYLIYDSKKNIDFILMLLMVALIYSQTVTRTGLLTAVGTIFAYIILKNIDIQKKAYRILIGVFPLFMTFLSLIITLFMSNNYLINKILSHRPVYWRTYLMHPTKGVNLFGYVSNIREILFTQRMPLDSGYIWSLYSQGLVVFVMLIVFYSFTMYILCKENKKAEILFMTSVLIYCFAESIMLEVSTNMSLVLVVYGMYRMNKLNIWDVLEDRILKRRKVKELTK